MFKIFRLVLVLSLGLSLAHRAGASQVFVDEDDLASAEAELERLEHLIGSAEAGARQDWADALEELRDENIYLKVKMKKHREQGGEGTGITAPELADLRFNLSVLRTEVEASEKQHEIDRLATLPFDTSFRVRLLESLTSATARHGDRFSAATTAPVVHQGDVVIPQGALLSGVVESVERPEGRTDRKAKLLLAFDELEIDGYTYDLTATVTGASADLETGIGDEKAKMGVGAGIGAVLGAVIGGKKGAVVGLILGGSGAILATEGKEVELPRGTLLDLRLDRDLTLPVR